MRKVSGLIGDVRGRPSKGEQNGSSSAIDRPVSKPSSCPPQVLPSQHARAPLLRIRPSSSAPASCMRALLAPSFFPHLAHSSDAFLSNLARVPRASYIAKTLVASSSSNTVLLASRNPAAVHSKLKHLGAQILEPKAGVDISGDERSLAEVVQGASTVVNLVG